MRWLLTAALAASVSLQWPYAPARAEDGDTIEGAIWRFEMTSKARKGEKRTGRFRVADNVLYQKDKPRDPDTADHVVGKNHPEPKKTTIDFDGLRTFAPPPDKRPLGKISGKAKLDKDEFGEWSGRFVASDGVRWDLKCTRIKE